MKRREQVCNTILIYFMWFNNGVIANGQVDRKVVHTAYMQHNYDVFHICAVKLTKTKEWRIYIHWRICITCSMWPAPDIYRNHYVSGHSFHKILFYLPDIYGSVPNILHYRPREMKRTLTCSSILHFSSRRDLCNSAAFESEQISSPNSEFKKATTSK